MTRPAQAVRIGYFGKIPARSDFIKAADNLTLVALLDQWLADTMNQLSTDARWKLNYDATAPLYFAFLGTRSRRAIAGHLIASHDQSQRRFPFLAMGVFEVGQPQSFIAASPVALAPLWHQLELLAANVLDAAEPEPSLQVLAHTVVELTPDDAAHAQMLDDFLDAHTVAGLEAQLGRSSVRQMILALGLLLQPVRRSGAARLDKSLVLPLPPAARQRGLVAAFWLALVAPFLQQADFELCVCLTELRGRPVLIIGFAGAAPETLQAIIDPHCAEEQQIRFDYTDWVDELIAGDPDAQRLSACLAQGQLTLRAAQALFHATFS
ncbi:MAG: type VI secretion system-associated protein TagF [Sphingomonadaceae bacterium]